MSYTHETTVLGGLPVTVEFDIESADPSVGIMSEGVGDWWISEIGGRPVKNADWVIKRMGAAGEQKLIDELNEVSYDIAQHEGYEDYWHAR